MSPVPPGTRARRRTARRQDSAYRARSPTNRSQRSKANWWPVRSAETASSAQYVVSSDSRQSVLCDGEFLAFEPRRAAWRTRGGEMGTQARCGRVVRQGSDDESVAACALTVFSGRKRMHTAQQRPEIGLYAHPALTDPIKRCCSAKIESKLNRGRCSFRRGGRDRYCHRCLIVERLLCCGCRRRTDRNDCRCGRWSRRRSRSGSRSLRANEVGGGHSRWGRGCLRRRRRDRGRLRKGGGGRVGLTFDGPCHVVNRAFEQGNSSGQSIPVDGQRAHLGDERFGFRFQLRNARWHLRHCGRFACRENRSKPLAGVFGLAGEGKRYQCYGRGAAPAEKPDKSVKIAAAIERRAQIRFEWRLIDRHELLDRANR